MHQIELNPDVLARVQAWRDGRRHIFDKLDPAKTAHIIVDLQNGFMVPGQPVEVPVARDIVPNVNRISQAVRAAGGSNIFLRYQINDETKVSWSTWFDDFSSDARTKAMTEAFSEGTYGFALYPDLDVQPQDLIINKTRFGAFIPGTCDLPRILEERGIDTLIITGTCTNVCCESTARDAMQLNYKVIFIADGNAAMSDAEHNATLNNMLALFADVMTTDELVGFLSHAPQLSAAAE